MIIIGLSKTLSSLKIEDAVRQISESTYGLHCLIVYPNLKTFREFYTHYLKRQIKKKEIILFNPFYETVGTVRQTLRMGHVHLDEYEFQHESDISLIISDSLNQYFGKVPMGESRERLVNYAIEKKKDGVSILGDMGSYFFKLLYNELIDYELSLPTQFDAPLKGLCIYNHLDFDNRLTDKQKQFLVDHHGMAINLQSV